MAKSVYVDPMQRLRMLLFVIAMLLVAGTVGYVAIEGYSVLDGLYMTVITLSTVGYGEVQTLSPADACLRLF